jgi:hypothetical protein
VNPATLEGWGSRPYDWQFGVSVQQELMPRVSGTLGYNRRWWGNFYYTDNRAVGASDFDQVTITAPRNEFLPHGGGYPVSFFLVKEAKFGQFDNYFTFAKDYGDVTYYWHGLDYDVNARMTNGVNLQIGASTGRGVRDTCEVQGALPESTLNVAFGTGISQVDACAVNEPWQTSLRGLASCTIPKIDVLVNAIARSVANNVPQTTQDGGDQRAVAQRQLRRHARRRCWRRSASAARRRGDAVDQPGEAGRGVRPAHQRRGHAVLPRSCASD